MDITEKICPNCGQKIFVRPEYVREQMFCTLGCLNQYEEKGKKY